MENGQSVKSVPLKGKITQFQEDFCRKGTQRGEPQPKKLNHGFHGFHG
jgi:hypothetical protein